MNGIGSRSRMLFFLFLILSCQGGQASDLNDLWLLISSYEYVGITQDELATFLISHGYDAKPNQSYVEVYLKEETLYLKPNGGSTGLADLWMQPPTGNATPLQVISADAIKKNVVLQESEDPKLSDELSRIAIFPVKPLGMCFEGAQQVFDLYNQSGFQAIYLYNAQDEKSQGHIWVAIKDEKQTDSWKAIDSYFGVMSDEPYYYQANYSFSDYSYLDSITPHWRVA